MTITLFSCNYEILDSETSNFLNHNAVDRPNNCQYTYLLVVKGTNLTSSMDHNFFFHNMKEVRKIKVLNKQTPWPLVRERTIPTERPPLVDEI
jgi:hypothetical protein